MGTRGPAPRTKKELAARGSWLAKTRPDELELESKAPTPPVGMRREAGVEWRRLVKLLGPAGKGVLAEADRAALVILCESWAEYRELDKQQRALMRLKVSMIEVKRVMSAKHESYQRWSAMAQRFGLTPADRPRVKAANDNSNQKPKGKDRFNPRLVG